MRAIEALLRRIARHPSPVLFTGETGVGKEICARFLHTMATSDGFILIGWMVVAYLLLMLLLKPGRISYKDLRKTT